MMAASAYGRLASTKQVETRTGTTMAVAQLAVEVPDRSGDGHTLWLGIVCFGRTAEALLRHSKGDLLSVVGRVQFNAYTDREGTEREQLQIIADAIVSARTVRPGGKRKTTTKQRDEATRDPFEDSDSGL